MKTTTPNPDAASAPVHYEADDGLDGQEPIDWMEVRGPLIVVTRPYLPDRGMQTKRVRVHSILSPWGGSETVHDFEAPGAIDAAIRRARATLARVEAEYLPAYRDGRDHVRAHPDADPFALTWYGEMHDRGYTTTLQQDGWEAGLMAEHHRDLERELSGGAP